MRTISAIIIHCSATPPDADIGAAEIDRWHKERGWSGIGYHYVIRRNGTRENGRPLNTVGAHAAGYNTDSIGVCLAGGVRREGGRLLAENNFTAAQWATLRKTVLELLPRFPRARVIGHHDVEPAKACPSFDVAAWLAREGIRAGGAR